MFRFETQHGTLCAIGYVTADCMSRTPSVSNVFSLLFYFLWVRLISGLFPGLLVGYPEF